MVFKQTIDKVDLSESRGILALMDYRTLELRGARYNKLYIDDGNRLGYYPDKVTKNNVLVKDQDTSVHIKLKDFNGNVSTVNLTLKASPLVEETPILSASGKPYDTELFENTLKVSVKSCGQTAIRNLTKRYPKT
ncbi:MAG: hypothetical protein U5K54_08895, partial [Cytophagales bacterium]|nr:hypothetical protein [Cytophagales bacterium]